MFMAVSWESTYSETIMNDVQFTRLLNRKNLFESKKNKEKVSVARMVRSVIHGVGFQETVYMHMPRRSSGPPIITAYLDDREKMIHFYSYVSAVCRMSC